MIVEQLYLGCLSQASYLIADPARGVAAVVDPRRDVDEIVARADELEVEIRWVLLTHFHADFAAGHLELRERCGARIALGAAAAETEFECRRLEDGEVLELGELRIEARATPGHTPESTCFVLYANSNHLDTGEAHAVFTGDTLFVGDVGRPDLLAAAGCSAEELARSMYHSLGKLTSLPDSTLVYPAHGAGSLCGRSLSTETSSTIGAQKEWNYALQPMSEDDFVAAVTARQPIAPRYFRHDVRFNRIEHPTLSAALGGALRRLETEEVAAHVAAGAALLDVRSADEWARANWPGSLQVGLDGRFASWAGTVVEPDRDLVLLVPPGHEREAAVRLMRVGLDRIIGVYTFSAERVQRDGIEVASVPRIEVEEALRRFRSGSTRVLDVRTCAEFEGGHIPGATSLSLTELPTCGREFESGTLVVCETGYRSSIAVSWLRSQDPQREYVDLRGGMEAWQAAGGPSVQGPVEAGTGASGSGDR